MNFRNEETIATATTQEAKQVVPDHQQQPKEKKSKLHLKKLNWIYYNNNRKYHNCGVGQYTCLVCN